MFSLDNQSSICYLGFCMETTGRNSSKFGKKLRVIVELAFRVSFFCMILSYLVSVIAVSFLDWNSARVFCDVAVYLFFGVFILSGCVASGHWWSRNRN